jgi:hypothetical protein
MVLTGRRYTPWFPTTGVTVSEKPAPLMKSVVLLSVIAPCLLGVGSVSLTKSPKDVPSPNPPKLSPLSQYTSFNNPYLMGYGSVFETPVPSIPPQYTSPPNVAPIVVKGWNNPHLFGQVLEQQNQKDDDNEYTTITSIAPGYSNPVITGRAYQLKAVFDQGDSAPNVPAYRPYVVNGWVPNDKGGFVKLSYSTKDVPNTTKASEGMLVVQATNPTPTGFAKYLSKFAQIDHDLQFAVNVSQFVVSEFSAPGWWFTPGLVWNERNYEAAPANQQKPSITDTHLNVVHPSVLPGGRVYLSEPSVFPEWDKAPFANVYTTTSRAPYAGSAWYPYTFKTADKLSSVEYVWSYPAVPPAGTVWNNAPDIVPDKLSPIEQYGLIDSTRFAGRVTMWEVPMVDNPVYRHKPVVLVSSTPNHFHFTPKGRVVSIGKARNNDLPPVANNDFLWYAGTPELSWKFSSPLFSWSVDEIDNDWTVGEPQE